MAAANESLPVDRYVRVAVLDRAAKAIVADVTLSPGSSVVLGSGADCTVHLPEHLGIEREMLIERAARLHFRSGMRINMMGDGPGEDHVVGDADELTAAGLRSPAPLRWRRFNIALSPAVTVFMKYLPCVQTTAETPERPPAYDPRQNSEPGADGSHA